MTNKKMREFILKRIEHNLHMLKQAQGKNDIVVSTTHMAAMESIMLAHGLNLITSTERDGYLERTGWL